MRTIHLREHEPATHGLTQDELGQVLTTGLVDVTPDRGARGEYRLRPGSIVGTVVLDGLRLLIRPKISVDNLFYMLGFGAELVEWAANRFPFDTHPDLLDVIGWMLEAEVRRSLRGGVVRGYREHEEALNTYAGAST